MQRKTNDLLFNDVEYLSLNISTKKSIPATEQDYSVSFSVKANVDAMSFCNRIFNRLDVLKTNNPEYRCLTLTKKLNTFTLCCMPEHHQMMIYYFYILIEDKKMAHNVYNGKKYLPMADEHVLPALIQSLGYTISSLQHGIVQHTLSITDHKITFYKNVDGFLGRLQDRIRTFIDNGDKRLEPTFKYIIENSESRSHKITILGPTYISQLDFELLFYKAVGDCVNVNLIMTKIANKAAEQAATAQALHHVQSEALNNTASLMPHTIPAEFPTDVRNIHVNVTQTQFSFFDVNLLQRPAPVQQAESDPFNIPLYPIDSRPK